MKGHENKKKYTPITDHGAGEKWWERKKMHAMRGKQGFI
jgi:hypothetical protein